MENFSANQAILRELQQVEAETTLSRERNDEVRNLEVRVLSYVTMLGMCVGGAKYTRKKDFEI